MGRRKRGLPPAARRTSSGRITITIRTEVDGKMVRLSHSKVLPTEPTTYADEDAAWEGYKRVMAYLAERAQESETLRGFWLKWTDVDHPINDGRSEQTVIAYKARTKAFVEAYGHLPLDAIKRSHLDEYRENGGLLSHVGAISRILHDALKRELIMRNPLAGAAADAASLIAKKTKARNKETPPPKRNVIEQMLDRLSTGPYPESLYGWFVCGTETGMRGGELDGMEWERLSDDVYWIVRQWNAKLGKPSPCKHGSERKLRLNPRTMAEIEKMRGNGKPYIWADSNREHWTHNTRDYWWTWTGDGGPSLRQICGGVTMYKATRHHWASRAVNEMGLTPYQASLLYGHSDGGKLITETYADPDHERAMLAAYEAAIPPVVDLSTYRKDDDDDADAALVAA